MDWQVGDEINGGQRSGGNQPTPRLAAMTKLESSAQTIGDRLRVVDGKLLSKIGKFKRILSDYQTHHRLLEATGRRRAEDLNERVMIWSLGQTATVVLISIGQVCLLISFINSCLQVLLLRSFFSDKRTRT
jgi:protein ERP2